MSEPPSMVIVPCALITVATPSSWYGLPDSPNPVRVAFVVVAGAEKAFHGALIVAANVPSVARNPRRFEASFMVDFIPYLTSAAMQLISTSELPGRAATATVVRAGPPCGK